MFEDIGKAFSILLREPIDDSVPVILEAVDENTDVNFVESAAHVLAAQPRPTLLGFLAELSNRNLSTNWVLEIYRQIPECASVSHLKALLRTETDDELIEAIYSTIYEVEGKGETPFEQEIEQVFRKSMRVFSLEKAYEEADKAFRKKSYVDVVRILGPNEDILSPVYQKKLVIAKRNLDKP